MKCSSRCIIIIRPNYDFCKISIALRSDNYIWKSKLREWRVVCTEWFCSIQVRLKINFNLEQTITCNEESPWEADSLISEREQEKIEFGVEDRPFVISLCKVEGESSEDQSPKDDDHSTGSSFKCYKHRSKLKTENDYDDQFARG